MISNLNPHFVKKNKSVTTKTFDESNCFDSPLVANENPYNFLKNNE